jgi:hypothetical protein
MAEDGLSVFSASSHDMSWDKPPFFAFAMPLYLLYWGEGQT